MLKFTFKSVLSGKIVIIKANAMKHAMVAAAKELQVSITQIQFITVA